MPRRVLYLTTSLGTLGPATALVDLAVRLDPERYVPLMVQLDSDADRVLERRLRQAGVALHSFGTSGLSVLPALVRLMRQSHPDVVQTRLIRADFLGRLAARVAGVPLVVTNLCDIYTRHFDDRHGRARGPWLRRVDQATLALAHQIVTNSEGVREDLLEHRIVPPDRVTTIYNGVDIARYRRNRSSGMATRQTLGIPLDAWVVGSVGRLSPKKRHDVLIAALPRLLSVVSGTCLVIVGEGECRSSLEQQARALGVEQAVQFLGERDDIAELLSAMDVFAFPSEFEGCPNAVLEAMSCELPVVAVDAAGTRELVVSGETGTLTPPGDADALANALLAYLDRTRSEQAAGAARAAAETRFSLTHMASRFQDFYDEHLPASSAA